MCHAASVFYHLPAAAALIGNPQCPACFFIPLYSLCPWLSTRLVSTPDGSEHASNHGSGADVVFLPRNQVQAGRYLVTGVQLVFLNNWAGVGGRLLVCERRPAAQPSAGEVLPGHRWAGLISCVGSQSGRRH